MCGRATLTSPAEDVAEIFALDVPDLGPPRFNLAPSQPIPLLREAPANDHDPGGGTAASRELVLARWGLVPWWARPDEARAIAGRCVQARAETLRRAPAFRDAFKRHRGLVVVDGFFEWRTLHDGRRVPHHVRRTDRKPFAIAALWDAWQPEEGDAVTSCAVVTTRATGVLRELHDRMPLVLGPDAWPGWLASEEAATALAKAAPEPSLEVVPVSTWVNDVRHDDPRCIEPTPIPTLPEQIGFAFAGPAPNPRRRRAR